MMHPIVGLAGYAGSGKDTAASALIGIGYQRRAFADPLKQLAATIGWDGHKDDHGRKLLQDLGVGCRQVLGVDVWVNALFDTATGPIVVTDVRFPNEVEAIANRNGVVVRITRPGCVPALGHVSETALDDIKLPTIVNDGDVFDLHSRLFALLASMPTTP